MSYPPPPPEGESSWPPGHGQPPPHGYDPQQPAHGPDPGQPGYSYGPGQPYGYGGPPYPPYYPGGMRPEHPGAVPSLVIGVIALAGGMTCAGLPLVLGPWAWINGKRTMDEIDASGGRLGGRGIAQGGFVCGVIATVLLGILVVLVFVGIAVALIAGTATTS